MISVFWEIPAALAALSTLPGTVELFALTAASLFAKSAIPPEASRGLSLAVVIPAHNEEANIGPCIESLLACEAGIHRVRVIVVADNCTDRTESIASQMGARVIPHTDPTQRGKGSALSYALRQLLTESFDAFIVLDADTLVEKNFIQRFGARFSSCAMAVQCRYLPAVQTKSLRGRLMHLALLGFHVIRPKGRAWLGFSSGIFGNGFGLSRGALESVAYHPGSITEDLEYHISLVRRGIRVVFEDQTTVRSVFPEEEGPACVQRSRWEGGRFRIMVNCIPALLRDALGGKRAGLEALFDLLTLPLAYHVLLILAVGLAPFPLTRMYTLFALGVVCFHVICATAVAGSPRDAAALLAVPVYIVWKLIRLPLILMSARKDADWVRTPRRKGSGEKMP